MTREITIPLDKIKKWIDKPVGIKLCFPVVVGWEELQLTEEQMLANTISRVNGGVPPFEDKSIFNVCIKVNNDRTE